MNTDRFFIALPVGEEHRSVIQQRQHALQSRLTFSKWVHPDDLHITLKFLGYADGQALDRISEALKEIADASPPFRLALSGLETFGKPSAPNILWVGVQGEVDALAALQAKVETAVEPLGFPREDRPFRPHITVAKKYKGDAAFPVALCGADEAAAASSSEWTVRQVVLYRTHMHRRPMYEAVSVFPLGG